MYVQEPRETITATTTIAITVRMPDSPVHSAALAPVVAPSKGPWMMAFQALWANITGQMLPVSRRMRAKTNAIDVTETTNMTAESAGNRAGRIDAREYQREVPPGPDHAAHQHGARHPGVDEAREHVAAPPYLLPAVKMKP